MFQALRISPAHVIIPATHATASNSTGYHHLPSSNVHLLFHHSHQWQPPQLRSLPSPAIRSSNGYASDVKLGQRTSGFHEIQLKVREYELDRYGVVNNAVYSSYCQHASDEFLRKHGVDVDSDPQNGNVKAISEVSFKFLAPLRSGDRFVVRMGLSACSAACLYFEHFIFKLPNEEAILEAHGKAVWLDKNYRPVRIPPDLRSKLLRSVATRHRESN